LIENNLIQLLNLLHSSEVQFMYIWAQERCFFTIAAVSFYLCAYVALSTFHPLTWVSIFSVIHPPIVSGLHIADELKSYVYFYGLFAAADRPV